MKKPKLNEDLPVIIKKMYAVRDVKEGFEDPVAVSSDDVAKRWFVGQATSKTENKIKQFLDDMELWRLGTYNSNTGEFTPKQECLLKGILLKSVS